MDITDLSNKIENGEEPPKIIKINSKYYEYLGNIKNIYRYKEIKEKTKSEKIISITRVSKC